MALSTAQVPVVYLATATRSCATCPQPGTLTTQAWTFDGARSGTVQMIANERSEWGIWTFSVNPAGLGAVLGMQVDVTCTAVNSSKFDYYFVALTDSSGNAAVPLTPPPGLSSGSTRVEAGGTVSFGNPTYLWPVRTLCVALCVFSVALLCFALCSRSVFPLLRFCIPTFALCVFAFSLLCFSLLRFCALSSPHLRCARVYRLRLADGRAEHGGGHHQSGRAGRRQLWRGAADRHE